MLCPKKGCRQLICLRSAAAIQPIELPASPGLGMIHILSNKPKLANLLLATQFKATPPPYTRFLLLPY